MRRLLASAAIALASSAPPAMVPRVEFVSLPGVPPVGMDYVAYDAATGLLWVPAGNTGLIDVLDTRAGKLRSVESVPVGKRGTRTVGASAATVGDGVVYVGNRADSTVCAFDARTLERRGCATLPATPDGLAYVATTREVWATTPTDGSLAILDVKEPGAPRFAEAVKLEGRPEGYAVDAARGIFYTNLEDADRTLAIDVRTHRTAARFEPGCGEAGPRGLALDAERRQLFVACTDRLRALDAASGKVLSELPTGAGVDNIDFFAPRRLVYVASGKEARLTVAAPAADGALSVAWTSPTAPGCRTVVADGSGVAYLPDSRGGRLVVVRPPR